jgi:hypothetical protein
MPCGCNRGHSRVRGWAPSEIIGYEYISPAGVSSRTTVDARPLTLVEARGEQRKYGGGTIKALRHKAPAR